MMAEARVRRAATQTMLKSVPSGLQMRVLRKNKNEAIKETIVILTNIFYLPTSSTPPLAKKQKLALTEPTNIIDHVVSVVMQEIRQGSRPSHLDQQFKFWENSFDGLRFL